MGTTSKHSPGHRYAGLLFRNLAYSCSGSLVLCPSPILQVDEDEKATQQAGQKVEILHCSEKSVHMILHTFVPIRDADE